MRNESRGFIALTSAIVISLLLLMMTVAGSMNGFVARTAALEAEYKERSRYLALACVEIARLALAHSPDYAGDEEVVFTENETCEVLNVSISGSEARIETRSSYRYAATYLEAVIDSDDFSIASVREVAGF